MSRQTLSLVLLATAIVLAILAALTLVPYSSSMISDLRYYTLCPFAPWSTLVLLFFAWLCWIVRRYINTQKA